MNINTQYMEGIGVALNTLDRLYSCIGKEINSFERTGSADTVMIFDRFRDEMTAPLFESNNYYELSLVYDTYATLSRNARQIRWGYDHTVNYISVMYGIMATYAYCFSGNPEMMKVSAEANRYFLQKAMHCCRNWHEPLPYHTYEPYNYELMGDICVFIDEEIAEFYYQKAIEAFSYLDPTQQMMIVNDYHYMVNKELELLLGSFLGEKIFFEAMGDRRIRQKRELMDKLMIFQ